ncbi:hypothetical protein CDL15_Pgr006856 [Punica granatum]|uniref:Protein phosphatase n=1 Tax=Punica granatum TaxID=22663 RepID=A0A218X6E7_PUNGR|nr:hypothetical protein CDL15_Pgr006856 [Punica granatum]
MPSSYFSKLRSAVQNGIQKSAVGHDGGVQSSVEVLVGQGKLWFGNSRFFHSVPFSAVSELNVLLRPGTVSPARSDSQLTNRRRNVSVVGALSRTFSIPSVSGPTFQVCGYHIDRLLSDSDQSVESSKFESKPMASCSSRTLPSDFPVDRLFSMRQNISASKNFIVAASCNSSFDSCKRASMSLINKEQPSKYQIYGYFVFNAAKGRWNLSPNVESGLQDLYLSSCRYFSAGTAPDVSFDSSSRDEQLASSTVSSEERNFMGKDLQLVSGSCYLPHPDKEETGGEDAHFICSDEKAIGVADGVGGWADYGIDSGQYSRELMSNSVSAIQEEPKGSVDPFRVLEKAHFSTKAKGSSTACIIALTDQGLHAINLGDSGFMVVRDGCTVFRSPVQQHDFNLTYQLESGYSGDLPNSGQVFTIPVAPGDVIIAGTDGLFDNLYNNEITAVVVHATRAGLSPQVTAQKIAALARQRAQDKDRQTPFSTAAQDAGFRYYGGKLDDITVVVSYITKAKDV